MIIAPFSRIFYQLDLYVCIREILWLYKQTHRLKPIPLSCLIDFAAKHEKCQGIDSN